MKTRLTKTCIVTVPMSKIGKIRKIGNDSIFSILLKTVSADDIRKHIESPIVWDFSYI
jgi:hypothetical protein